MPWKLSTVAKKQITEKSYWSNSEGERICQIVGWRWGHIIFENEPDISEYDPEFDQIDVNSIDDAGDVLDFETMDGCYSEWEFPEGMDEEEQQRLIDLYDEDYDDGLATAGWYPDDTELWFAGELELEEIPERT